MLRQTVASLRRSSPHLLSAGPPLCVRAYSKGARHRPSPPTACVACARQRAAAHSNRLAWRSHRWPEVREKPRGEPSALSLSVSSSACCCSLRLTLLGRSQWVKVEGDVGTIGITDHAQVRSLRSLAARGGAGGGTSPQRAGSPTPALPERAGRRGVRGDAAGGRYADRGVHVRRGGVGEGAPRVLRRQPYPGRSRCAPPGC